MTIEDDGFVTLYATDHRPPSESFVRASTPSTREEPLALRTADRAQDDRCASRSRNCDRTPTLS